MAASDQHYRNQKMLDIIFSVSCILMFAGLVWMFAKDHNREYKDWIRKGKAIEIALLEQQAASLTAQTEAKAAEARKLVAQRLAAIDEKLAKQLPPAKTEEELNPRGKLSAEEVYLARAADDALFLRTAKVFATQAANLPIRDLLAKLNSAKPRLVRTADRLSAEKALRDSLVSQRDILKEQGADDLAISSKESEVDAQKRRIESTEREVEALKIEVQELEQSIAEARRPLTDAIAEMDRLCRERERLANVAKQRQADISGFGALIRSLPVLDFMASPTRVQQNIPEGLTIDYNFKHVQRTDRCITCHMFMDRPGFEKESLNEVILAGLNDEQKAAYRSLKAKQDLGPLTPDEKATFTNLAKRVQKLTPSEIAVYCNHPRQDLYVNSNSPHSAEKFGCTICHSGQGGAVEFKFAYHFPDRGKTDGKREESFEHKKERWEKPKSQGGYDWHEHLTPDYHWDFPMVPGRFIESSCLKCHHQVMDLIATDGRENAPKVLRGYRLVKDLGCFTCHEIAGWKGGRSIGPDLRLEPYPPLDELTPAERAKALADPTDPPGTLRKVGPGLRRVAEKMGKDPAWIAQWTRSPRALRPDTKMPHFFGQHNNHPTQLADADALPGHHGLGNGHGTADHAHADHGNGLGSQLNDEQRHWPAAELQALAFYLTKASEGYLSQLRQVKEIDPSSWERESQLHELFVKVDQARREDASLAPRGNTTGQPADAPPAVLVDLVDQGKLKPEQLVKEQLVNVLAYFRDRERLRKAADLLEQQPLPPEKGNAAEGAKLFQTKGCVACHQHEGILAKHQDDEKLTELLHEVEYGPNLIGMAEKLKADQEPERARKWLHAWLANPYDYYARTRMPAPQLTAQERADLTEWLLTLGNVKGGKKWEQIGQAWSQEAKHAEEAKALDAMVLMYLEKAMPTKAAAKEGLEQGLKDVSFLRADADERILAAQHHPSSPLAGLSHGERKQYYLGRKTIGRYGCYSCHDIPGFETTKPIGVALNDWGKKDSDRLAYEHIVEYVKHQHAEGYDQFYLNGLEGKRRDGFLYQKLREPRSYDVGKLKDRPWDDRYRMPQFKFARVRQKPGESDAQFAARAARAEEEAIEAVMTFILGLVAEPVNPKFVHQPKADRLAEVKGLKIIEKHNCNGCHVFKPGSYEVRLNEQVSDDKTFAQDLIGRFTKSDVQADLRDDFFRPQSNAWKANKPSPPDRLVLRGLPRTDVDEDGKFSLELWEAVAFSDGKEKYNIPAGQLPIPLKVDPQVHQHEPYGGLYAQILARILAGLERKNYVNDRTDLMGSVPPPLMREGQKVNPRWLAEFLRNPHGLRPAVYRNLKMPKFALTDEEAEDLVKYFVAMERLTNPELGIDYFAPRPPQFDPLALEKMRGEYRSKLKQHTDLSDEEIARADYFEVGWKMIADRNLCLKCHNAGTYKAEGELVGLGPSFQYTPERIRPEYFEHWVGTPKRLIPYSKMPQYYFWQDGKSGATRAALKLKPTRAAVQTASVLAAVAGQIPLPPLPLPDGAYNQLQVEAALTQDEKVRAVRDAVLSWGFLPNPPPTAQSAGPRPDAYRGENP